MLLICDDWALIAAHQILYLGWSLITVSNVNLIGPIHLTLRRNLSEVLKGSGFGPYGRQCIKTGIERPTPSAFIYSLINAMN